MLCYAKLSYTNKLCYGKGKKALLLPSMYLIRRRHSVLEIPK